MEGRTVVRKGFGMRAVGNLMVLMVVLSGLLVLGAGVASAAEECPLDPYGNEVCPSEDTKFNPDVEADVLTRPETPPDDGETLPFTGADVTLFVITGAALVATGMLVVRRSRAAKSEG